MWTVIIIFFFGQCRIEAENIALPPNMAWCPLYLKLHWTTAKLLCLYVINSCFCTTRVELVSCNGWKLCALQSIINVLSGSLLKMFVDPRERDYKIAHVPLYFDFFIVMQQISQWYTNIYVCALDDIVISLTSDFTTIAIHQNSILFFHLVFNVSLFCNQWWSNQ